MYLASVLNLAHFYVRGDRCPIMENQGLSRKFPLAIFSHDSPTMTIIFCMLVKNTSCCLERLKPELILMDRAC